MFLIINLNPAIDCIYNIPKFSLGHIYRTDQVYAQAGGKGVNVARASHIFGCYPLVTGVVGGYAGSFIRHNLDVSKISHHFSDIENESRTCLILLDPETHTQTVINEEGPHINPNEIEKFWELQSILLQKYSMVVLSGSLPPSISSSMYADILPKIRERGGISFVDASKDALKQAIQMGPTIVRVNIFEIAEISSDSQAILDGYQQQNFWPLWLDCQKYLLHYNCKHIIVSLGEHGAIWCTRGKTIYAIPPKIEAVNTVGSGDAMLAGILAEFLTQKICKENDISKLDIIPALIRGIAAGSANAMVGSLQFTDAMCKNLSKEIEITYLFGHDGT